MNQSILITHLNFTLLSLKSHFLLSVKLFCTDFSCLFIFIFYGRRGCEHKSSLVLVPVVPSTSLLLPEKYSKLLICRLLSIGERFLATEVIILGYEYTKVNIPSGMTGIGGVTMVHPAFLKRSICKTKIKKNPPNPKRLKSIDTILIILGL